jgi:hypothetical protein
LAKTQSRRLVIDASIAMAAGDISMHPTSRHCREFLQAVLTICHRAVMTRPIKQEWDKHQSNIARRWRLSMVARKKLEFLQIDKSSSLEEQFSQLVTRPRVLAILEKDRHLIEAALASDNRVASLDEEVRAHLKEHNDRLPELRLICWVNPDTTDEDACDWLRAGAPVERSRTLGNLPPRVKD